MLQRSRIPLGSTARQRWAHLDPQLRKQIVSHARRGIGWPDRHVAELAVGWAWAVLGAPESRGKRDVFGFLTAVTYILTAAAPHRPRLDIFDGDPSHDENLYVRHVARLVERANPVR